MRRVWWEMSHAQVGASSALREKKKEKGEEGGGEGGGGEGGGGGGENYIKVGTQRIR